jgi:hypothetical protein
MNIYTGLLFQHGYIQDADLAVSLAGADEQVSQARKQDTQEAPRDGREGCGSFHGHAVSFVCGTTALSPFR